MPRSRLAISKRHLLPQLAKMMVSDPKTTLKLMRFQAAKESFDIRHPFGAEHGRGDKIRLVSLRITDMCNLRCHTCGQWGDNGYLIGKSLKQLKQRELPVEVYKKLVDDVVEMGGKPIWYIWGGEPMLYPGLIELLHYIHDKGMPISLVTNSTRVAKYADDIVETCKILHISVDGPDAETHNKQRPGTTTAYDNFASVKAALEAVKASKEKKGVSFPFLAPITCITQYNIDQIVDIYKFTSNYADAQVLYLTWWIDQNSADAHTNDFKRRFGFEPTTHQGWIGDWKEFDHVAILDRFDEMKTIFNEKGKCPPIMMPSITTDDELATYYSEHNATFGYNQCVSIFMTVEVNSNGNVSLCRDYNDYVIGNIGKESIKDIWNNEKARKFRGSLNKEGLMPVCRRCCGLMGF